MYEELVKRLKHTKSLYFALPTDGGDLSLTRLLSEAADAIEELIGVIQNHDFLESLMKPDWISVTEKNHPKAYEPVMVIYVGWNDALPHRDCTAYWSEDEGLWRWAETNDKVKVPITHYMPLPPLPQPPKEEE